MGNDDHVQIRILQIVRTALLNNSVKLTDNIFEAGGDSLNLLEICSEVEEEFEVEIPLESVWEASSIAEFAAVVRGCLGQRDGQTLTQGR
jgi:acyl carrier protein